MRLTDTQKQGATGIYYRRFILDGDRRISPNSKPPLNFRPSMILLVSSISASNTFLCFANITSLFFLSFSNPLCISGTHLLFRILLIASGLTRKRSAKNGVVNFLGSILCNSRIPSMAERETFLGGAQPFGNDSLSVRRCTTHCFGVGEFGGFLRWRGGAEGLRGASSCSEEDSERERGRGESSSQRIERGEGRPDRPHLRRASFVTNSAWEE